MEQDASREQFISEVSNAQIRTIGPELVFGKIYNHIGYKNIRGAFSFSYIQAGLFRSVSSKQ